MGRSYHYAVVCLCVTLAIVVFDRPATAQRTNQLNGEEKSAGWQLLFDGKSLDAWQMETPDAWVVENGEIVCKGGASEKHSCRTRALLRLWLL